MASRARRTGPGRCVRAGQSVVLLLRVTGLDPAGEDAQTPRNKWSSTIDGGMHNWRSGRPAIEARRQNRRHHASVVVAAGVLTGGLLLATSVAAAVTIGPVKPNPSPPRSRATSAGAEVFSFGVVGGDGKIRQLERHVPTPVAGLPADIVQVATSNSDSYALTAAGTVWAWGAGGFGQLGNGTRSRFVSSPVEVRFPAGVKVVTLANPMPYNSGLAIDSNGYAWGWGYDPEHALCLSQAPLLWPTRLPLSDVTMATGAGDHTLFGSKGKIYACGRGSAGELGNGSTLDRPGPAPVAGLPPGTVEALTSSWQGSGALMADGDYYDWGYNRQGQLGDGTNTNRDLPVQVRLPGPVVQVWQGGSNSVNGQTLSVLADGSVWAWGAGGLGQLGDGSPGGSAVPVPVEVPSGVQLVQVCSGGDTSYGIDTSGRVWAWGGNGFGQLGNGASGVPQYTPMPLDLKLSQFSATATNFVGLG